MKIKVLGKNIGIYSLGNVALRAGSIVLIPIYTRYLTVENYGLLDICLTTIQILIILMSLGMPQSQVRFYREHEIKEEIGSLFTSSLVINLLGAIVLYVCIWLFRHPLSELIFDEDYVSILVMVGLVACARSLTQSSLSYFRAKNQAFVYSALAVAIMLGLIAINILFVVVLKKGILGILQSYLYVYGVAAVFISFSILLKNRPILSFPLAPKLFKFGLPLIFSMSGWFIIQMSSRYFLVNFSDLTEVGIYGLGYRIVTILQIVIVMPFQLAFGPFIFSHEDDQELKKKVSKIFTYLLILLFVSTWLTGLLARHIVHILAPPQYRQSYLVVWLLLPSIIALGLYYWAASLLHLKQKTILIGIFIVFSAIANIILNFWLIPKYGWVGAAVATNLSVFLALILNILFSQKFYKVSFEKRRLFLVIFSFVLLCVLLVLTFRFNALVYLVSNGCVFILITVMLYNLNFLNPEEKQLLKTLFSRIRGRKKIKYKDPYA